jgi:plastocyanin
MLIFAVEDHHQKARQDAIAKIEPGAVLRIEAAQPLWDRPVAIELRSPRGPKGASLGYAPSSVAAQLATMLGGALQVTATALRVEQRHGLRQLVVGVTVGEIADLASPVAAEAVEQALASAPKEPVLIPTVYPVGIVGEASYQPAIRRAKVGQAVRLVHEPSNPHDERAISVQSAMGECIGYLPRDSWLHRVLLDEGKQIAGRIKSIEGSPRGVVLDVVVGTAADLERAGASAPEHVAGEQSEQAGDAKTGGFNLSSPVVIIGGLLALALLYQCTAG